MENEEKQILEETLELTKENNKMLKKVRGVQKRQFFWTICKVVIIVGIAFGVFYYVEPYLMKVMNFFTQFSGAEQSVNSDSIQDLLRKF